MSDTKELGSQTAEIQATRRLELRQHENLLQNADTACEGLTNQSHTDPNNYQAAWMGFVVWLAVALSSLCVFLDEGIISTAIPQITDEFHSLADLGYGV